jgi:hypothetical protein
MFSPNFLSLLSEQISTLLTQLSKQGVPNDPNFEATRQRTMTSCLRELGTEAQRSQSEPLREEEKPLIHNMLNILENPRNIGHSKSYNVPGLRRLHFILQLGITAENMAPSTLPDSALLAALNEFRQNYDLSSIENVKQFKGTKAGWAEFVRILQARSAGEHAWNVTTGLVAIGAAIAYGPATVVKSVVRTNVIRAAKTRVRSLFFSNTDPSGNSSTSSRTTQQQPEEEPPGREPVYPISEPDVYAISIKRRHSFSL